MRIKSFSMCNRQIGEQNSVKMGFLGGFILGFLESVTPYDCIVFLVFLTSRKKPCKPLVARVDRIVGV